MNIRGTDSAALAAVTDLFVTPAPSRDAGAGGFQQALQPPRPYETSPTATSRQDSTPHKRTEKPESPTDDSRECEHEACSSAEPSTAAKETEVSAEQSEPVTEEAAAAVEPESPVVEEATDEQDVAAESLAAAAIAVTEQQLPEQQLPVIATEALSTEPSSAEQVSEVDTALPIVETVALEAPLATAAEQASEKATSTVSDPTIAEAAAEAVPELPEEAVSATEPTAGIGVLPSAIAPQRTNTSNPNSAPRTRTKAASAVPEATSSAQTTAAELPQETAAVDSSIALSTGETKNADDDSAASSKKKDLPFLAVDKSPAAVVSQPNDLPTTPELKSDLPAAASEAPVVSELHSTHNPAPDATKLTTQPLSNAAITNRLPAQALVRGTPQEKTPAPLHVDAARFLQRVTKAFESARERGGEIRLRLSPPELGALRVEVNMSEQGLAARVEVETNDARTILLENLPALRERLAEQGLRLERFDVELSQREPDQHSGNLPDQSRDRQSQPGVRTARNPTPRPNAVAATQSEITPTTGWQDRQLNVIV